MQKARSMTLIEHLTLVEETRSDINRKHDLVDVMFLVISAIMSGAEAEQSRRPCSNCFNLLCR